MCVTENLVGGRSCTVQVSPAKIQHYTEDFPATCSFYRADNSRTSRLLDKGAVSHAPAVFAHSYILLRGSTYVFYRYDKDTTLKGQANAIRPKTKQRIIPQGKVSAICSKVE